MSPITIDSGSPVGPARQIVEAVLDRVAASEWVPGDRLPSVRDLAVAAMLNPNTVGKAYRELALLGAVEGRSGSGVFVTEAAPELARRARSRTTLESFRRAARAAAAAGHLPEDLARILEAAVASARSCDLEITSERSNRMPLDAAGVRR